MNELIITTTESPIVCSCDHLVASEPFFHADRTLDFNVLIFVAEGTIYVSEGGIDHEVCAGELLFLKSGVRHYGTREIPRGTDWYYAHFYLGEPSCQSSAFLPDSAPLGTHEKVEFSAAVPKKLSGLKGGEIEQGIIRLSEYCNSDDILKRMRINAMLHSLLIDTALLKYNEVKQDTLSERICVWLNEHCTEPFSSERLEHEFFLSYKRLAAVFKQERGETMQQYHTRRRMSRACSLLRSTLMPIGEIAASLGFDDPLYFSKCFRAFAGESPRDYRTSVKSNY